MLNISGYKFSFPTEKKIDPSKAVTECSLNGHSSLLTLLVLQGVQELLILGLEHHDKAVGHDFASPIFTHLAHNNVV